VRRIFLGAAFDSTSNLAILLPFVLGPLRWWWFRDLRRLRYTFWDATRTYVRLIKMSRSGPSETSLDAAMRAPSTQSPDVVVLDNIEEDVKIPERVDPKKDLWMTTYDG